MLELFVYQLERIHSIRRRQGGIIIIGTPSTLFGTFATTPFTASATVIGRVVVVVVVRAIIVIGFTATIIISSFLPLSFAFLFILAFFPLVPFSA